MGPGHIGGRHQKEEDIGGLAVQRLEVHAPLVDAQGSREADDGVGLAVRNGDAVADPRAHDLLPFQHGLQDLVPVGDGVTHLKATDQLLDDGLFAVALEADDGGIEGQDVQQGHSRCSRYTWVPRSGGR